VRPQLTFTQTTLTALCQLLLRKSGDATPLLHAMRIGDSHREVQIVLLGAFSRWVNCLDEDEIKNPQTRVLLKALRAYLLASEICKFALTGLLGTNLKLAIDYVSRIN